MCSLCEPDLNYDPRELLGIQSTWGNVSIDVCQAYGKDDLEIQSKENYII